jgi:hypothetical protein
MPYPYLILPTIVGCGLVFGWILARWMERRYDRGNMASSEELLDGLEIAYTPRRSIEIRVRPDQLRRVFECLLENIDSGFAQRHARQLIGRIDGHHSAAMRHVFFAVKVNGIRTDLDLHWSRDADDRVRLLILAVPKVIRALKQQAKRDRPAAPREVAVHAEVGNGEAGLFPSDSLPQRPAASHPQVTSGPVLEVATGSALPPRSPA